MTYDELYRLDDEIMLRKMFGYSQEALDRLYRYKNLRELAKRKSFLSKATFAREAEEEFELLERVLKDIVFYMDFQISVNDPLADGEELDDHGEELKAHWDYGIEK